MGSRAAIVSPAALASLLLDHPFADAEPLLLSPSETVTAGEARHEVHAIADALIAAGVKSGQAVAVQLPDGPRAIATMFAVWVAGAIFVPVNPRAPEPEVLHILDTTGAVARVAVDGIAMLPGSRTYEPGTAFVTWTSGTTGAPKPILHSHASYVELLDRVVGSIRGDRRDDNARPTPNLIPVSLALNAGIYNVLFGLRVGAAIVVMDRFTTTGFATLVARHGIQSTVLPPAAITMLADDPGVTALAPLRFVRSITAPLSPLQARRFIDKFGVVVLNGYGQAEIGEVIGWSARDAREHPEKLGALGRPHPGVDVKIVTDDGSPADDPDVIGRLFVRAPSMARGDATNAAGADLAARLDAEGYLDTGDLGRVDGDGFVWIEGRVSDLINRGGNKVYPDQVEEVLRLVPGVAEVAVVGASDARLGEVPVAFVVEVDGATVADDDLRAVCRAHLAPYKVPVAFHRIDALPRSEVGKVLRRELAGAAAEADRRDAT
ncbi:MAG TPA: AMP-binding protein [Acidimicrobiia bacterium]|nr:AMP-binding protein [Acidimicrobiia bacterium]